MSDPLVDQWKLANPFPREVFVNGETRLETQAEYDADVAARAITLPKDAARRAAASQTATIAQRLTDAMVELNTPVGTTGAEVRTRLIATRDILKDVLQYLKATR